jgi:hypothetical protein
MYQYGIHLVDKFKSALASDNTVVYTLFVATEIQSYAEMCKSKPQFANLTPVPLMKTTMDMLCFVTVVQQKSK